MSGLTDEKLLDASLLAKVDFHKLIEEESDKEGTDFTVGHLLSLDVASKNADLAKQIERLKRDLGASYESVLNWKVLETTGADSNARTGLYGVILEPPDQKDRIVAFRDTEAFWPWEDQGQKDFVGGGLGLLDSVQTNQQAAVEVFLADPKIKKLLNESGVYFAGHSLGGNLAEHAAVVSGRFGLADTFTALRRDCP